MTINTYSIISYNLILQTDVQNEYMVNPNPKHLQAQLDTVIIYHIKLYQHHLHYLIRPDLVLCGVNVIPLIDFVGIGFDLPDFTSQKHIPIAVPESL